MMIDRTGARISEADAAKSLRAAREEREIADMDRAVRRKRLIKEAGEVSAEEAEAWKNDKAWRMGSQENRKKLIARYGGLRNIPGVGTKVVQGKTYQVDEQELPTAKGYGTKWF